MVSIFEKLGKAITKRPWAFIALWLVIMAVSLPLIFTFTEHLQYDTEKFVPNDLGANVARDAYDQQFPANSTNQFIVVVSSDNNTTSMHFIDALDAAIKNDTSIKNVTGTSSIYDVQRNAVVNMTPDLYHSMYDAYDNVSDGNGELYNATDVVMNTSHNLYYLYDNVTNVNSELMKAEKTVTDSSSKLYAGRDQVSAARAGLQQIRGTADIIYGLPLAYAGTLAQANASGNDFATSKAAAARAVDNSINAITDPSFQALAAQYMSSFESAFDAQWQASYASDPAGTLSGWQAMTNGIITDPTFKSGFLSMVPSQYSSMFGALLNLGVSGYQDRSQGGALQTTVVQIAMASQPAGTAAQQAQEQALLNALYPTLGMSSDAANGVIDQLTLQAATQGLSGSAAQAARDIYALGRGPSWGTVGNYVVGQAIASLGDNASQDARSLIQDAWNIGPTATKQDFDKYVLNKAKSGRNATENQSIDEIYNWGPDPNDTVVRSYVLQQAGKDLNASENQSLADVYDLGRNASGDTIKNYVVSQVLSNMNLTTNDTYFMALLNLDRNLTDAQLKAFAADWEASHGYNDPQIMPNSVVNNLASGNLTLYIVSTSDDEAAQGSVDKVQQIRDHIKQLLKGGQYPGVQAYVTGATAMAVDAKTSSMNDVDNIDKITILMVLILLFLYFRSYLTPFVPLLIIGVAVVASFGLMGIFSTQMDIYYLVMTMMVVIMLGAGTDYCVFMLSRYAEERSKGNGVKESVTATVAQAGKSIASSGSTAMIGFGSLMLIDSGVFRSIGIGTAVSILMSMLVALTLVPAVLTIAGDRLFWPRKLYQSGPGAMGKIWRRITGRVLKRPLVVITIALLVTVPAVVIFMHLELGNDTVSMLPNGQESKEGYNLMDSQFGSGAFDKAMVVATLPVDIKDASGNFTSRSLGQVEQISSMLAAVPGVDKVYSATRPEGLTINYDNLSVYKGAEKEYYQSYMDNATGDDDRTTVLYVSFNGSPYSVQSEQAIDSIQASISQYDNAHPGTATLLGGTSVGLYEYEKLCTDKYALVIPIVLIGIFFVLMLLLRSVFTPARLIMTLLMSISWTVGTFVLVFQDWMQASVYWILPIILFCVLMGLGIDYDIFLVTRIREEVFKGKSDEEAIVSAVESVGTIIMLCGLVMASAFGSMMISNMMMLKEFGFVLFLAILLDATLMRLVVVPSIMVLMKKYNWWMPFVKNEMEKAKMEAMLPAVEKPEK